MNSTKVLKLQLHYAFRSSGSARLPQIQSHPHQNIDREVNYLAEQYSSRSRILALVPTQHIYGHIWSVLLPQKLKIECWNVRHLDKLIVRPGDMVIGFPGLWPKLATLTWPADIWLVSSGSPLQNFPPAPEKVIDVYGSTETAGLASRTSAELPFELFPYWPDYLGGIDAPDELTWLGPRTFHLQGRLDGAVQVSGINVYPAKVAEVLMHHPQVYAAAVRLMRPEEGNRLKAFIVGEASTIELANWLSSRLTTLERPVQFTFGARLPLNVLGKPSDW